MNKLAKSAPGGKSIFPAIHLLCAHCPGVGKHPSQSLGVIRYTSMHTAPCLLSHVLKCHIGPSLVYKGLLLQYMSASALFPAPFHHFLLWCVFKPNTKKIRANFMHCRRKRAFGLFNLLLQNRQTVMFPLDFVSSVDSGPMHPSTWWLVPRRGGPVSAVSYSFRPIGSHSGSSLVGRPRSPSAIVTWVFPLHLSPFSCEQHEPDLAREASLPRHWMSFSECRSCTSHSSAIHRGGRLCIYGKFPFWDPVVIVMHVLFFIIVCYLGQCEPK